MNKRMDLLICLLGKICSGKSTIGQMLSENLVIPKSSFGGYLIHYSNMRDLPTDRQSLQNLGEKLIESNALWFLNETIDFGRGQSKSLILDGVRHKVILDGLNAISEKTIFICVDADLQLRYQRYLTREKKADSNKDYQKFLEAESHKVEQETERLREVCHIVIDSKSANKEDILSRVKELI
jgi:dephospho-CoA kinase